MAASSCDTDTEQKKLFRFPTIPQPWSLPLPALDIYTLLCPLLTRGKIREIQTVVAGGWEKGDVYPNPDGFCSYFLHKLGKRDKVFMCLARAGLAASGVLLSKHFRRGLKPLKMPQMPRKRHASGQGSVRWQCECLCGMFARYAATRGGEEEEEDRCAL